MGGPDLAVLGLLCLLSRAVLPGFAQEVATSQNIDREAEVSAVTTVSSIVNSTVLDFSSIVPEFTNSTHGGEDNETVALTDSLPSEGPSTTIVPKPSNETSAITEVPQETNSSSAGTASIQAYTDAGTRGVDGPTQLPSTAHTLTASMTEVVTTRTPSSLTESLMLPSTSTHQTLNNTVSPLNSTQLAATTVALHTEPTSAATTNLIITNAATTAQSTSSATQTAATLHTSRPEMHKDPSGLEVGGHKDIPGFHSGNSSNPLFVMIVSVFTIMVVMVVVAVGFHRYKKRNRRTDFRRLQDLPMDDMMEDTPLALYSY